MPRTKKTEKKIFLQDQTGSNKPPPAPELPTLGLSAQSRIKLDKKRQKRARREAEAIGRKLFFTLVANDRKAIDELVAILKVCSIYDDTRAKNMIVRALAEGFANAGIEHKIPWEAPANEEVEGPKTEPMVKAKEKKDDSYLDGLSLDELFSK